MPPLDIAAISPICRLRGYLLRILNKYNGNFTIRLW